MKALNLGILAHVDAGKTSLTERLLFDAGVTDEIGSVDHGNTQTDSLALERQRGITIKSAVVSFAVNDVSVNLIDTPGHSDFIAEVERVLSVLDGAVLVVSAVEGVQPQTRVLMRTLRRLRIPTLIFVNKLDRSGADCDRTLAGISEKLNLTAVAMGSAGNLGTRNAEFKPFEASDSEFATRLIESLADHNDALLAAYVKDESSVSHQDLLTELAAQTGQGLVHPVYFGSAFTGAGVAQLIAGIETLLPARAGEIDGPAAGTVFKVERGAAGEKIAYLRMYSGTLRVRDRVEFGPGNHAKITAINVFAHGRDAAADRVSAGRIARLWGLADIQIGDTIGDSQAARRGHFAPPTLETVVVPQHGQDKGAMHAALAQLAEQDPLINLRQDDIRQEVSVSLYGEVQKEVIQATLAAEYGINVGFRETTTICVERVIGTGAAAEFIAKDPNPFLGTVGLRIDPAAADTGVEFRLAVELGSMPLSFMKAIEESVTETLQQGLHGWQVVDCVVTLTHSGYWARQSSAHGGFDKNMSSTARDFRQLTPLVLMDALRQAGTAVLEPMHRFQLELPPESLTAALPLLTRLRAVPQSTTMCEAGYLLEGEIPADSVHELEQRLPGLTSGEGVFESTFELYRPVSGQIPERQRWDHNPLNRKEYLLHVARRVA